ncbi:hypothetical protein DRO97_00205 [Archaeoglobales archaeon]|nr:MAG: hypothetical protein DRO97_00205 [Archaeoglobales archaeon]
MKRLTFILSILLIFSIFPVSAKYIEAKFEFEFQKAPTLGYTLKCIDAYTGVIVYVKTDIKPNQEYSFSVSKDHKKILCLVSIPGGPVIYKARIYPPKYYQGGGFSTTVTLPDADKVGKCGDGKVSGIEKCDIVNNKGCIAGSPTPKCCRCEYCGCGSDKDCPKVTGTRCGYGRCSPQEIPVFRAVCYDCGICIYPYRCFKDPRCKEVETKSNKSEVYSFHIDSYHGTISDKIREGETKLYSVYNSTYLVKTSVLNDSLVEFEINQETTKINKGKIAILSDGTLIGVEEVIEGLQPQANYIKFYLVSGDVLRADISDFCVSEKFEEFKGEENIETIRELYNTNLHKIPIIASLFSDERVNLYVEGDTVFSFITKNGRIESISEKEMKDQTVNIYTDVETMEEILEGKIDFIEAIKSGKIRYEGVGFFNSFKFNVAKIAFKILSTSGLI